MLFETFHLLQKARQEHFALGAFNVYNLEGALSVIHAAQELKSPVILQVLPSAFVLGGTPLIHLCLEAGKKAVVPVAVQLDHCSSQKQILSALDAGISSVMADGSMLDYKDNIIFTKKMVRLANKYHTGVEAELGRISGSEDGLSIEEAKAKMTLPSQAIDFVEQTKISALAVCIGNIHGKYKTEPDLDFDRLMAIKKCVSVPLVLHGTSGLPDEMIQKAIDHGVCKFNVNTEVKSAYLNSLNRSFKNGKTPDLIDIMQDGINAMKHPIKEKLRLFASINKAFQ